MPVVQGRYIGTHPEHPRLTEWPKDSGAFRYENMSYNADIPPAPGQLGRLSYGCPRGKGHCGAVVICNGPKPPSFKVWGWDGNIEKPTLTPSINCLAHGPDGEKYAGCGWHGFVRSGIFED